VVVENSARLMERLGFGYAAMRRENDKINLLRHHGIRPDRPDAFKPAYDQIIQGLSGLMSINGDERLNPLRCGFRCAIPSAA